MIALKNRSLTDRTTAALASYQHEIDVQPSYPSQVAEAKRIWPLRRRNAPFIEVKATLSQMCSGARRCCYCEDSMADEIEHIWPKDFYPSLTFVWENYLYACGPCNGPKGSRFALFSDAQPNEYAELKHPLEEEPSSDHALFINPRQENPLDFLWLDVCNTFAFTPLDDDTDSRAHLRAKHTIGILKLNLRDDLVRARRSAYLSYRARLSEYISQKESGASQETLTAIILGIQTAHHPTVWKEMQRQHLGIEELRALFAHAPEALTW
jgi:uncharacterized protein (TIGR02646 family)